MPQPPRSSQLTVIQNSSYQTGHFWQQRFDLLKLPVTLFLPHPKRKGGQMRGLIIL